MGWSRNPDLLYKQRILNDCWQGNFSLHLYTMPHVSLRSWGLAQVIEAGVTWLLSGGLAPHSGSCHQLIKICWGEIWPRFHHGPSLPAALKTKPLGSHLPSHCDSKRVGGRAHISVSAWWLRASVVYWLFSQLFFSICRCVNQDQHIQEKGTNSWTLGTDWYREGILVYLHRG